MHSPCRSQDYIISEYRKFGDEAKVLLDVFFEIDIIMRDYHKYLATTVAIDESGATETNGKAAPTGMSQLGFAALSSWCSSCPPKGEGACS